MHTDQLCTGSGTRRRTPALTVLVPTRNESGNVAPLVGRLRRALDGIEAEVLFVDDSDDDTPAVVQAQAGGPGAAVRLLHRRGAERTGGLGGAVLAGLAASRSPWVVVMDGDLQHPPELVPQLHALGVRGELDLVVASRHASGGDSAGLDGPWRRLVSCGATRLVRALFPRGLRGVSDPMSGFFAVRRDALQLDALRPRGFKVLLEVALRSGLLHVGEVPFVFAERGTGQSKAGLAEGRRFLLQLLDLRVPPRARRALGLGLVGLSGLVVNLGLAALLIGAGTGYLLAAVLATQGSSLWNGALAEATVYRRTGPGSAAGRLLRSVLLNDVLLLARLPLLALLVETAGVAPLPATALTLLLAFALRFHATDRYIYASGGLSMTTTTAAPAAHDPVQIVDTDVALPNQRVRGRYLPYRYDVAGVLTVGSEVPLRELEWFRSASVGRNLDIEVRIGAVGGRPRSRTRLTKAAVSRSVSYEEHLGRLGANFEVDMGGDRILVTAGPLLARSPHVLYTNVIEALLRFVVVSRGKMLLHSACLELDGRGVLLSARTDTGKTGTVLRLVRERGARFLSDDMTILSPDGWAQWFPKPLTISQHTLRAVQVQELSSSEWRRLRMQSRLHSKEGRAFGTLLAEHNLPIMGVNALTQLLVPPPKYDVQRLVDCDLVASTRVCDLFVIERGAHRTEHLSHADALDELILNTDDAYGFPPFRWFAPAVVLGDDDYETLRAKERALLERSLASMRLRRLASDTFSWADDIADVLSPAGEVGARADADTATAEALQSFLAGTRNGRVVRGAASADVAADVPVDVSLQGS